MSSEIPEYYRSMAASNDDADEETDASDAPSSEKRTRSSLPRPFRADAFELTLPDASWDNQSDYTFSGPSVDDMTHEISIAITDVEDVENVTDFAAEQMEALKNELDDCRPLFDDAIELTCGHPAHRAIFVQCPTDGERVYYEQIYTLDAENGYTLTALFTPTSRKQIGEAVENVMRSFRPAAYGGAS